MKKLILLFLISLVSVGVSAQIVVTGGISGDDMVDQLVDEGVEIVSVTVNCPDASIGLFEGGTNAGIGVESGIIMTSGQITDVPGPNESDNITFDNGAGGDTFLDELSGFTTNNACVLIIDLIPCGDILTFDYVFASDEYNEFACSNFNDVFGFLVTGPNPNGGTYDNENVALIPATDIPVAINTVNNGQGGTNPDCITDFSSYFIDNDFGDTGGQNIDVEYDGMTVPFTAQIEVSPDETYTIYLAVADASDTAYDSGVFIEAGSLSANFVNVDATTTLTTIEGFDFVVEDCVDGVITFETNAPVNEDFLIIYEVSGTAEAGSDYEELTGYALIPTGGSSATINIQALQDGVSEEDEEITITVFNNITCEDIEPESATFTIIDQPDIIACCDQTIEAGESVQLTVEGGFGNYTWTPNDNTIDDVNSATPTVTPTQSTTYVVSVDLGNCVLTSEVTIIVGECDNEAGTVSADSPVCYGDNITATADGQVYEEGAILGFALHNSMAANQNESGFELYGVNSDGSFANDGNTPQNQTLYLSPVVGQDDGTGLPDLADPCTIIGLGAEVVFLEEIMLSIVEDCDWDETGDLTLTIMATGGLPSYMGSVSYTINGTDLNSTTLDYDSNIALNLGAFDGQIYSYNITDDGNGCSMTYISEEVVCYKTAVELISFNGNVTDTGIALDWTTGSEIENEKFIIERSNNGQQFTNIGEVAGNGTITVLIDYDYVDMNPFDGANYYRLKQVDYDGTSTISDIITFNWMQNVIELSVIQHNNSLIIDANTAIESVEIFNLEGKLILNKSFNANQINLNITSLNAGIYTVRINEDNKNVTRFVK